ncbi:MAG: acylase [Longimicrobiales bacterium]
MTAARARFAVRVLVALWVGVSAGACGGQPSIAEPGQPSPRTVAPIFGPMGPPTGRIEILWDTWGIPHIYAKDEVALLWAYGWAQMHSHGDRILRLYGQSRGRAAEYWGEAWYESDTWVQANGIPARAREWYAAQNLYQKLYIEAFVAGLNAYAIAHPDRIADDVEVVLPLEPGDVFAHVQRVIHFGFVANPAAIDAAIRAWQSTTDPGAARDRSAPAGTGGSNAWAIAPARTEDGHALLLANPHLPWDGEHTWFEGHLIGPDIDAYGATLIGFPLPVIAFNRDLGWTHTVNTLDGWDLFQLSLERNGYRWDGRVRPIESETLTLRVKQADGTVRDERLEIRRSLHGPILSERGGRALALRVVGLDRPRIFEQTWNMLRARDLGTFEGALGLGQLPMFSVMYADREGHIMHVHNGLFPKRTVGTWADWSGVVRGDTSSTLWSAYHAYYELPRAIDPESGWLQNANDPPWTTTFPPVLDPARYPPTMAPRTPLAFRPQRSARMLMEDAAISLEEMIAYKYSTYVEAADHIIEDLVLATRMYGSERAQRAAVVLQRWDRQAEPDSRGMILFAAFYREWLRRSGPSPFELPWMAASPLTTPDGLADPRLAVEALDAAAAAVESTHGALDVAWGDVHRLRMGGLDFPANGGPGQLGIFRVLGFSDAEDGRDIAIFGDSYVAAVEFGDPVRAFAILPYGNASQPGSNHRTDQLALFARKRMRRVLLERSEIERSVEFREAY